MSYDPEPEINHYLSRLSSAAHDLPKAKRRELLNEIEQHIRQALAETPCATQAEMLTLLDQVGDPTEIVAAGTEEPEQASTRSAGWEIATILLLLLGGFVFLVGWLVGVMLLWSSNVWTLRDKLLGTFVIPGGLATAVLLIGNVLFAGALGSSSACVHHLDGTTTGSCTGGTSTFAVIGITLGLALVLIAPLVTAAYLKRRLNKQKQRPRGYASDVIG